MGKILFAIVLLSVSCALFKWPGFLVRDDAKDRLWSTVKSPASFFKGIMGQGDDKDKSDARDASGAGYPLPMTISNAAGTALDVTVLGKGPDFLRFKRNSDKQHFDLKFSTLAETSLAAIASLPANLGAQDYQQGLASETANEPEETDRTDLVEGLRKEIERNEQKIKEQQALQSSGTLTSSQASMTNKTMERLKTENALLKIKLEQYESDF